MRNSQRSPKCSRRIKLRPAILYWGLLSIAFASSPANPVPQINHGTDQGIPQFFNPGNFSDAFGCTIVMAARNGLVLAGNNEDRNHPKTIVTFLPAAGGYYGRVVFGYDDMPVQGGMNDQGLFIDGNSLSPTGWKPDPGKPTFRGSVLMVFLGTCATCEDVKAFFETNNVPALERARIPVAGVLHPVQIAISRRGGTSTYVFKDIAADLDIEEKRFAIPDLAEAFPKVFEGLPDSKILPLLKDFPSEHEDMNIPCRDGRFLYDLILRKGYKRGLEIGSFTGYSALWMGWAFTKTGGKLIGIEIDSGPGEKARRNILTAGLDDIVDIRIADAFQEISQIKGEFDFVFIDAWKAGPSSVTMSPTMPKTCRITSRLSERIPDSRPLSKS